MAAVRDLRELRDPVSAEELEQSSRPTCWPGSSSRGPRRGWRTAPSAGMSGIWTRCGPGSADRCGGADRRRRVLREGAAEIAEWHPAGPRAGPDHVLPVPGTAAQGRDPSDDRPGRRVPDRRDEPASGIQGRGFADPADRAGGQSAVHRLGRRAGDLPQVHPDRAELHRIETDVAGGTAGERGMQIRPGRHQVGPGPVRQASRASRQGRPRLGPT